MGVVMGWPTRIGPCLPLQFVVGGVFAVASVEPNHECGLGHLELNERHPLPTSIDPVAVRVGVQGARGERQAGAERLGEPGVLRRSRIPRLCGPVPMAPTTNHPPDGEDEGVLKLLCPGIIRGEDPANAPACITGFQPEGRAKHVIFGLDSHGPARRYLQLYAGTDSRVDARRSVTASARAATEDAEADARAEIQ